MPNTSSSVRGRRGGAVDRARHAELARRARATLDQAGSGTLRIAGFRATGLAGASPVLMPVTDGVPAFACPPGSALRSAAWDRRAAVFEVPQSGAADGLDVVLCGRLRPLRTEDVDGVEVAIVALEIDRVFVECEDDTGRRVVRCPVPSDAYRSAPSD